jgi:hypothetical protein
MYSVSILIYVSIYVYRYSSTKRIYISAVGGPLVWLEMCLKMEGEWTLKCTLRLKLIEIGDEKRGYYQQNVNQFRSHMPTSQTPRSSSPVLQNPSRWSQAPMEQCRVHSNSARSFSDAAGSTRIYGAAFRLLQELTYRIVTFESSWDLCVELQGTSRVHETSAPCWGRLREQLSPLCSSAEDLVAHSHSSGYCCIFILYTLLLENDRNYYPLRLQASQLDDGAPAPPHSSGS